MSIFADVQNRYPMIEVMLVFPSPELLWAFRTETSVDFVSMDKERNVLTCKCFPSHVELAITKFQAAVLVQKKLGEWD